MLKIFMQLVPGEVNLINNLQSEFTTLEAL